jgi:hypothetical protein
VNAFLKKGYQPDPDLGSTRVPDNGQRCSAPVPEAWTLAI